jgi:lipoprotein NlpD
LYRFWQGLRNGLIIPLFLTLPVLQLAGCTSTPSYEELQNRQRQTSHRPTYHTVRSGETLYSIAWRYGYDYRSLARRNGIRPPYTIYVGQRIRVNFSSTRTTKSTKSSRQSTAKASAPRRSSSSSKKSVTSSNKKKKPTPKASSRIKWTWPAQGKIITTYASNDPHRKGLDISGRPGQAVNAAAAGEIVYSGSGLLGLGMLIIVKHDENYLSAYGHNRKLLKKEGDKVKAGQRIAEMGKTGTDRVKLHFEIRRDGQPVDPMRYLPKR